VTDHPTAQVRLSSGNDLVTYLPLGEELEAHLAEMLETDGDLRLGRLFLEELEARGFSVEPLARPGHVTILATDTPEEIDRKMAEAMAPVRSFGRQWDKAGPDDPANRLR
jgi:hypothetical protein